MPPCPERLVSRGWRLTRHGAEVGTAGSVAEALVALRDHPPDLLLADIGMPGEDGHSLIQRVRALPDDRLSRMPAVALTGYAQAEDRLRALAAGFQQHIAKPVLADELVAVVASTAAHDLRRRPSRRSSG